MTAGAKAPRQNRDESQGRYEWRRLDVVVGVVIVVGVVVIQVNNWSSFERNRAKRSLEGPAGEVFREEADDGDGDVVERRQVGGQRRRRPADREVEHARRERKGVGL